MAATVNDRDALIMSETRTEPVTLPSDISISGDVTGTLNGVPVSTVVSNSSDGYTAFQDTVDFRVPGAPTNSPIIGSITASSSAVGTVDIKLTWTYTQGAIQADSFVLYYDEGTTNPTTSSPMLASVDGNSRDLTISGVPMDKSYKIGIVAARRSAFGVQTTAIVNAWTRTGDTANITANIDGVAPSGVKNSGITLSSSGTLLGAGGGSITALDYTNVSGTKPPANATANFFTSSASDPTGGSDGDAHYNSSTNVMWFKTAGVWQKGGTINASQITTGTLAAARIAASSITSDKLSVSTLSAITANLGTVNAGFISGSADIDITGRGVFNGAYLSSGITVAILANPGFAAEYGIIANAGATGAAAVKGQSSYANSPAIEGTTATSGSIGVRAVGSGGATALAVSGPMTMTSTTVVSNLNADMVDGYHSTSLCRTAGTHSGTATVSSGQLDFFSTVSGISSSGGSNDVTYYSVSDRRLKCDITPEQFGIEFIRKLKPCTYRLKDRPEIRHHGFISQDVGEFLDENENDCFFYKNPNGYYGTDYPAMTAPIVKAIQQIDARIVALEKRGSK